jgi:hypothetical protein
MNKRNLGQEQALENGETPATFDATWKQQREPDEYRLEYDTDMVSKAFDERFRQHVDSVWKRVKELCSNQGHRPDGNGQLSRFAIFNALAQQ